MLGSRSIAVVLLATLCVAAASAAEEDVYGPPKMVVDVRIEESGSRGEKLLVGTVMHWEEVRQNWNVDRTVELAGRTTQASQVRSRGIFILQKKRLTLSLRAVRLTRLNGERIDRENVAGALGEGRAVAFLPKGAGIHPQIAKTLHPDTIVVTRVSYPESPLMIDIPTKR